MNDNPFIWQQQYFINQVDEEINIINSFKEQQVENNRVWEEYYNKHNRCPQCKSTNYSVTLMGFHRPPDHNRALCYDCGWVGTRENMVE